MPEDTLEALIAGLEAEARIEAKDLFAEVAIWAAGEISRGTDLSGIQLPPAPGGGQLAGMTLDEALGRAEELDASVRAKLEAQNARRKLAGEVVSRILTLALRTIVTGGLAVL